MAQVVYVQVSIQDESGDPGGGGARNSAVIRCSADALDAVLFDFNVGNSLDVTVIKALSAGLVEKMREIINSQGSTGAMRRAAAIAINEIEGVQMRAVKALFAKYQP